MADNKNKTMVKFVSVDSSFNTSIVEQANNDMVMYGEDNQLPYLIKDYYATTPLHNGILEKKTYMVKGDGYYFDDENKALFNQTLKFFQDNNLYDVLNAYIADFIIYGGAYLQIVFSRDGKAINKIGNINYELVRAERANKEGLVENYFVNPNKTKAGKYKKYTKTDKLIKLPVFGSKDYSKPQVYYVKNNNPITDYYGMPGYLSALYDLDTYRSISIFHNSNIHNGLQPSYVIMFKGPAMSPDKQDEVLNQIKKKHKGIENAGKPLVFFLDNTDVPEIQLVDSSDIGDMFNSLYANTQQNIITAHQIPRALSGVATEGSLGGGKEIYEAEQVFQRTYVKPLRSYVLNKFNVIMAFNGLLDVKIQDVAPDLSIYSIDELLSLYEKEEVKKMLNLPLQ